MLQFSHYFMRTTREGMQGTDSKSRATPQSRLFGSNIFDNSCDLIKASLIEGLNGLKHRVLKGGRLLGLEKSVSQQGIIKSSTLLSGGPLWGQSVGSRRGGRSAICGFMRVGLQFSNCILFLPLFLSSVGGCTAPKEPMGGTVNAHTVNVKNAGLVTITVLERDTTEKQ